jgi:parvulin-like peptidyl-prolyl isomerase
MAKMRKYFPWVLGFFTLCLVSPAKAQQERPNNNVAAVVNNEAITMAEVLEQTWREEQELRILQEGGKITDEERKKRINDRRRTVLESLIVTRLIIQDYKKKGYSLPQYYFRRQQKDVIRDQYGGDRQALATTLEERGETMADWRKKVDETFIVQYMRQINAKRYITISPHMIEEYYQQHVHDFLTPDRVKLRMIRLDPENSQDAEATAKDVLSQIESGSDFSQLAKKYSDYQQAAGGLYHENNGWVKRGDINSQLSEVAFTLRPGQPSGVISITTEKGAKVFYILQVEEVKKATVIPLSNITRNQIENTLMGLESTKVEKDWINRLKRDAYIDNNLFH